MCKVFWIIKCLLKTESEFFVLIIRIIVASALLNIPQLL